jgi:hypothetical protein
MADCLLQTAGMCFQESKVFTLQSLLSSFIFLVEFSFFSVIFSFFLFWRNELGYENGCGNIWHDVVFSGWI